MKIDSLEIQNFCNHTKSELILDDINIIQGPNNAGKTPVADAIQWLLTGVCRNMTDCRDRAGEMQLIKLGTDKTIANMVFMFNGQQYKLGKERTKSGLKTILQIGVSEKKEIKQDDIFTLLRTGKWLPLDSTDKEEIEKRKHQFAKDERRYNAIFNAMNNCLALNGKERKQVLFDILGEVNEPLLRQHLQKHALKEDLIPKIIEAILANGFEATQNKAIEKRKEFKRDLAKINPIEPVDELVKHPGYKLSQIDPAKTAAELAAAKSELEKLLSDQGKYNALLQDDLIAIDQKKMSLLPEIENIKEQLTTLDKEIPSNKQDLIKKMYDLDGKIIDLKDKVKPIEINIRNMIAELNDIQSLKDRCPKCKSILDPQHLAEIIESLEDKIKLQQDEAAEVNQEIENLTTEYNTTKLTRQQISDNAIKRETSQLKLNQLQLQYNELTEKAKHTKAQTENARQKLDVITRRLPELRTQITLLETINSKSSEYHRLKAEYDKNIKESARLKEGIEVYDKLDKLLSPQGIINDILQESLAKFAGRLNQSSQLIGDQISIDSDLQFSLGKKPEAMLDRHGSEWLRLSWIVSEALSHFSGLRLWICDRVDILDDKNKSALMGIIMKFKTDYDTIILLSTKNERPVKEIQSGIKLFWIENGVILI